MWATLLMSIFSGGATGLLGVIFQRYFDMKAKQQELEVVKMNLQNSLDLKRLDIEQAGQEWKFRTEIAGKEAAAKIDVATQDRFAREVDADSNLLQASFAADRASFLTADVLKSGGRLVRWAMAFVDFVRGLIRPGLTIYLVVLAHLMYNDSHKMLVERGSQLTTTELQALSLQIVGTLLYLATTAVVWWFGTRPPKKSGDK